MGIFSFRFISRPQIGVGWLVAYRIETPFLTLCDSFFPARTRKKKPAIPQDGEA